MKVTDPVYLAQLREWEEKRAAILTHYATSQNYAATARTFGVSRQRVAQLVKESKEAKSA